MQDGFCYSSVQLSIGQLCSRVYCAPLCVHDNFLDIVAFALGRWRGSKANVDKIKTTHDLDNHKSHWKATGDAKCIKQYNGSHQWTSQPPPKPPITRRQTVVTSTSIGRPPMPFPGTNSTGESAEVAVCDEA